MPACFAPVCSRPGRALLTVVAAGMIINLKICTSVYTMMFAKQAFPLLRKCYTTLFQNQPKGYSNLSGLCRKQCCVTLVDLMATLELR
jgi:hypothetical protein